MGGRRCTVESTNFGKPWWTFAEQLRDTQPTRARERQREREREREREVAISGPASGDIRASEGEKGAGVVALQCCACVLTNRTSCSRIARQP